VVIRHLLMVLDFAAGDIDQSLGTGRGRGDVSEAWLAWREYAGDAVRARGESWPALFKEPTTRPSLILVPRPAPAIIGLGWSVVMPANLSIENAPDDVVERLRRRAKRHGRSLRSELLAIIETASREDQQLTATEILAEARRLGLKTPREATGMIRADRNDH